MISLSDIEDDFNDVDDDFLASSNSTPAVPDVASDESGLSSAVSALQAQLNGSQNEATLNTLGTQIAALLQVNDPNVQQVAQALQTQQQALTQNQASLESSVSDLVDQAQQIQSQIATDPTLSGLVAGTIDTSSWGPDTIEAVAEVAEQASQLAGQAQSLSSELATQNQNVSQLAAQVSQEQNASIGQAPHPLISEIASGVGTAIGVPIKYLAFGIGGLAAAAILTWAAANGAFSGRSR